MQLLHGLRAYLGLVSLQARDTTPSESIQSVEIANFSSKFDSAISRVFSIIPPTELSVMNDPAFGTDFSSLSSWVDALPTKSWFYDLKSYLNGSDASDLRQYSTEAWYQSIASQESTPPLFDFDNFITQVSFYAEVLATSSEEESTGSAITLLIDTRVASGTRTGSGPASGTDGPTLSAQAPLVGSSLLVTLGSVLLALL